MQDNNAIKIPLSGYIGLLFISVLVELYENFTTINFIFLMVIVSIIIKLLLILRK